MHSPRSGPAGSLFTRILRFLGVSVLAGPSGPELPEPLLAGPSVPLLPSLPGPSGPDEQAAADRPRAVAATAALGPTNSAPRPPPADSIGFQ